MATNKPVVLVADDEEANRALLEAILEDEFSVTSVDSGENCLHSSLMIAPDIILLDISMPEMDGFETCRRLKEDQVTKNIPVVFISALSAAEDKDEGFQAGAEEYITKPIQPDEVVDIVNMILLNHQH